MDTTAPQPQKQSEIIQENQTAVGGSSTSSTVTTPVGSQATMPQSSVSSQNIPIIPPVSSQPATPQGVTQIPHTQQPLVPSPMPEVPAGSIQQPQTPQEPVVSSSHLPESEPIPAVGTNEWAKLSEPEVVLPDEVVEAGVETIPVNPPVTPSQQAVGVMPANEATPVQTQPTEEFHFPFTLPQTEEIIHKDKDIRDSLRWLALLIFREIAMARRKKQLTKTTV